MNRWSRATAHAAQPSVSRRAERPFAEPLSSSNSNLDFESEHHAPLPQGTHPDAEGYDAACAPRDHQTKLSIWERVSY